MGISHWRGFSEIENLRKEMDRVLNSLSDKDGKDYFSENYNGLLIVDVIESQTEFVIEIEIPGIRKKDITLNIADNIVIIKGIKKETILKGDQSYFINERKAGSFERVITLPFKIEVDKVKASYSDGILKIKLPKFTGIEQRKVNIEIE